MTGFGNRAAADVEAVLVGLDESLYALLVGVRNDDFLDRSNLADRLELRVRLDAGPDESETRGVLDGEVVGGDGGRRTGSFHRQRRPVHDASGSAVSGSE